MATMTYPDAYGNELGKMIVKREGLDVNKIARDWEAEGTTGGAVLVTLHVPVFIERAEWDEITAAAWAKVRGE